jgi:uncharacterized repeat protein (TIGR03837 family)
LEGSSVIAADYLAAGIIRRMLWDLFCRVIDNHGDIGVCWRLAADLGARGESVRLWVDDASALAWMAPQGAPGVTLQPWTDSQVWPEPGDVVVEAFGCDPPPGFVARMAARAHAPCWVNLEYLSAQAYAERSHGLPSPQTGGPGAGLVKRFFYPGFTPSTGGLIREPGLLEARAAFDADVWLDEAGAARTPGERVVSLFCYANPALPDLIAALAQRPTLLLATAGLAAQQVRALLGPQLRRGALRAVVLPHLTQAGFDRALWSSDLNFVRGEDSFVRAQWVGAPFVWQAYPQDDGAHAAKIEAFLDRHLADAAPALAGRLRALWRGWNAAAPLPAPDDWPEPAAWATGTRAWRDALAAQTDLSTQLLRFASEPG